MLIRARPGAPIFGCLRLSPDGIVRSNQVWCRRLKSAVWKGGVCDVCARCGLCPACPSHRPPEEHYQCATAQIPTTPLSAGCAAPGISGSGSSTSLTMMRPPTQSAPGSCKGSPERTRTMRSTACLKATAGRPGISQRQRSAARSRTRHGWSPTSQRSIMNSASSRQEKKLTYFSSAVACRGQTGPACSLPNATGTRRTGSFTGMSAT